MGRTGDVFWKRALEFHVAALDKLNAERPSEEYRTNEAYRLWLATSNVHIVMIKRAEEALAGGTCEARDGEGREQAECVDLKGHAGGHTYLKVWVQGDCPDCDGWGVVVQTLPHGLRVSEVCPNCEGTGSPR